MTEIFDVSDDLLFLIGNGVGLAILLAVVVFEFASHSSNPPEQ